MKIYFIFDGKKHEGPFSIEELQAKGLKRDTYVWKEGLPDWVHADKIEELEYILPAASAEPVAAALPPEPVVEQTPATNGKQVEETETEVLVEVKKEEPRLKETIQPVVETVKPQPKVEVKEVKPQPEQKPAPQKKFAVEEEKVVAKQAKPAPAKQQATKAQPVAAKKSKAGAIIFFVLLVLAGGGVAYYLYSQNQEKKQHQQVSNKLNIDVPSPDKSSEVSGNNEVADKNTGNTGTIDQNKDENKDEPLITTTTTPSNTKKDTKKTEDKTDNTNTSKTTNNPTNNKTDNKQDVKKDKIDPVVDKPKNDKNEPQVSANPVANLSVSGSYKKNFFGEAVLEGKISNGNGNVQFKSVVIEAKFIGDNGQVLKSEQFTKSGVLPGNGNLAFKFKTNPPKDVKAVSYRIVSAQ
jgi:hypothetical protein